MRLQNRMLITSIGLVLSAHAAHALKTERTVVKYPGNMTEIVKTSYGKTGEKRVYVRSFEPGSNKKLMAWSLSKTDVNGKRVTKGRLGRVEINSVSSGIATRFDNLRKNGDSSTRYFLDDRKTGETKVIAKETTKTGTTYSSMTIQPQQQSLRDRFAASWNRFWATGSLYGE